MKKLLIALSLVLVVTAITLSPALAQGPPSGVPPTPTPRDCQEALGVASEVSDQVLPKCPGLGV